MISLSGIEGLGTYWSFELYDTDNRREEELRECLTKRITSFGDAYSRFRDDSYVGVLNNNRVLESPPEELINLLQQGVTLYEQTKGRFNMITGHIQEAHGYDKQYSFTESEIAKTIVNPQNVLSISKERITLETGNVDLGGFGKGYLIDVLATLLRKECNVQEFLINGGGDMYGSAREGSPIDVYLTHPHVPDTYVAKIPLKDMALACSSTHLRKWKTKNTDATYSHIIAPDAPDKEQHAASFIVAKDAVTADAFATVACLLTPNQLSNSLAPHVDEYLHIGEGSRAYFSEGMREWLL